MVYLNIFQEIVEKIFKKKNSLKIFQVSTSLLPLIRRHNLGPKPEKKLDFKKTLLKGDTVRSTHSEEDWEIITTQCFCY